MTRSHRLSSTALLASLVALNGCGTRVVAPPPAPIAAAPIPPRPTAPAGVYGALTLPPVAPDGSYATINHGIDAASKVWHVRAALNVAALGCRAPGSEGLTSGYNAMLRKQRTVFASADSAIRARYRSEQGSGWQQAHDVYMTRLYNYFAQPAGQAAFCQAANAVMAETAAIEPSGFGSFAATALSRLDAPFTNAYAAYAGYRRDLAAWEARYGPNAVPTARFAEAAPPAVPVAAPAPVAQRVVVAQAAASAGEPTLRYAPVITLLDWSSSQRTRSADRESRKRMATAG